MNEFKAASELFWGDVAQGSLIEIKGDEVPNGHMLAHFYETTRDGLLGVYRPEDAKGTPLLDFVWYFMPEDIEYRIILEK